MAGLPRGIVVLVILCAALVATLAKPQGEGDRYPPGSVGDRYHSSGSHERARTPYNQPEIPDYGSIDDYGSRNPNYGRRTRPTGGRSRPVGSRRQGIGGRRYNPNQPPQAGRPQTLPDTIRQPVQPVQPVQPIQPAQPQPDTLRQPVYGEYNPQPQPVYNPRPQPPPETPRQPVFGGYNPQPQPDYNPRPQPPPDTPRQPVFGGYNPQPQPVYNPHPQPPPDTPRQPVFGGYNPQPQPDYNPRPQPQPDYNPRPQPQPDYNPRPQPQPDYNPRPQPQPDYNPRPQPQPDYNPRPQPQPDYNPRPQPQPDYNPRPQPPPDTHREVKSIPGGRYQGVGELDGTGPNDFVVGNEGVLCAPTCRGHCIKRDADCNCVQDVACFNEYKHRLEVTRPDSWVIPTTCREIDCNGPCEYKVQWPDKWCMCEVDPLCTAKTAARNSYNKREADLDKLISQRDAQMAELRRASRHSQKTKRHAADVDTEE